MGEKHMNAALWCLAGSMLITAPHSMLRAGIRTGDKQYRVPQIQKIGLAVVIVGLCIISTERISIALSVALLGATLYRVTKAILIQRQHNYAQKHMGQFMAVLVGELESGATTEQGLWKAAAETSHKTIAQRVRVAVKRARAAGALAGVQALEEYAHKIPAFARIAAVWELSHRHGIAQVPLFNQVQTYLDEQQKFQRLVAADIQGAQLTAIIVSILPIVGMLLGLAIGVNALDFLFGGGIGGVLLVVGVLFLSAGIEVSHKIIDSVKKGNP
ncbi:type II secretion system F family protein [Corynebacterium sp. sy039]|uniref:type II secretion system F family protein n=1 Tax=Corynebacterium sp. sy039 TaxID=2599641 RepID=UPI0011B458B1|nr:type II secretion system F family protein [Corynebacterium sp. sy039]QDZ43311.1 hypothetical protein FQV43_09240 [Corynebacterium sp. sy039]